jgi:hypothetical protein
MFLFLSKKGLTFVYFIRYPLWTPTLPSVLLLSIAFWLLLAVSEGKDRPSPRSRLLPRSEMAQADQSADGGLTLLEQVADVVPCADSLLSVERALALPVANEHVGPEVDRESSDHRQVLSPGHTSAQDRRVINIPPFEHMPVWWPGGKAERAGRTWTDLTASWSRVVPVLSSSAFRSRIAALGDLRILRISADGPSLDAGVDVLGAALVESEAVDGVARKEEAAPGRGELI